MTTPTRLSRRQFSMAVPGFLLPALAVPKASAQAWPHKPLRLVVPFAPGGASDTIARLLSERLARRLGQPVVVENKPGAATIIGVDTVAKAGNDGHTLLLAGVGSYSVLPALRKKLPFDVDRDLAYLGLVAYTPNILVTAYDKPFRTLPDLIKAARAKPREIRYATYGDGSANHLCGELLSHVAGVQLEPIAYKGAADAKLALLRGEIDLSFETLASVGGELKGNRLRALAHGGAGRSKLLPDLPGLAELGWGEAAVQPFFGLTMPAGTPEAVRTRLSKEILDIMGQADVKELAGAQFLEPVAIGADEMKAIVGRHTGLFRNIAQQLKLSLD